VPGKELKRNRTTSNLREHGMRKYGYGKPIGGSIPRIREAVSDEQMKEMKIDYITSLHDPITASDGSPDVLNANRGDDGPWVNTYWGDPDDEWDGRGAFAFPVSASQP
jgi:hypothetical protein